jgi:hypothetical protein
MPVINPLQALVHPQTQEGKEKKKLSCMDCQSPTPTSQNSLFFGEYICKLEIVDFNLPSN